MRALRGSLWLALIVAGAAAAQSYPSRPIRWVVPSASGATSDITTRLLAERLGSQLSTTITVDNRPGAGGNIAAEIVARAPADGYTLLTGIAPLAVNPSLYAKLSYDPLRDLAPVILSSSAPLVLVVHPSLPVKSVKALIALARAHPGELTFPSAGNGTSSHLAGELFKTSTDTQMVHVPYKAVMQGVLDLVSGRMSLMINVLPEMIPFIRSGKLDALAVTGMERSHAMPELPTVHESGVPGFTVTSWQGVVAPGRTPPELVGRINQELNKVLRLADVRARMMEMGLDLIGGTPEDFGRHLRDETAKWAKVVKASGARVD